MKRFSQFTIAYLFLLGMASAQSTAQFGCREYIHPNQRTLLDPELPGLMLDAITVIRLPVDTSAASLAFGYSATEMLYRLSLHGARVDGATLTVSVTYPARISDVKPPPEVTELRFAKPSPGDYRLNVQTPGGCALGTAGHPSTGIGQLILRVEGLRATLVVSTLSYMPIGRYFMTASLDEVQFLRATPGIGASFALLDDNFRAWPTVGDAPPGVAPVCRFFRASTITHAYSADAAECAAMKANPQWSDEGVAFRALVPTAGACASGTEPIYKLTNATLGDTQRYTRSEMTYRTLQLNGWTARGVAFCSPVG